MVDEVEKPNTESGIAHFKPARRKEDELKLGKGAGLKPYLPNELIGGSVPHILGNEDQAVWNAAAQACGTDNVAYTYTVDGGKCWYLACPSSVLATNPDSWCPLAAALPGNSEYWDRDTVYLYEQEGAASALRWDNESGRMQVFLGASRTVLPRVQSMDANFVTINPDVAEPVAWQQKALNTERLSRMSAKFMLFSGMLAAVGIAGYIFLQYASLSITQGNLKAIQQDARNASLQLMKDAVETSQNEPVKHFARVQELLNELHEYSGSLRMYKVNKDGSVVWEALVPRAYADNFGSVEDAGSKEINGEPYARIRGKR